MLDKTNLNPENLMNAIYRKALIKHLPLKKAPTLNLKLLNKCSPWISTTLEKAPTTQSSEI